MPFDMSTVFADIGALGIFGFLALVGLCIVAVIKFTSVKEQREAITGLVALIVIAISMVVIYFFQYFMPV